MYNKEVIEIRHILDQKPFRIHGTQCISYAQGLARIKLFYNKFLIYSKTSYKPTFYMINSLILKAPFTFSTVLQVQKGKESIIFKLS